MRPISGSLVLLALAQPFPALAAAPPSAVVFDELVANLRATGAVVTVGSVTPVDGEDRVEIRGLSVAEPAPPTGKPVPSASPASISPASPGRRVAIAPARSPPMA